jgi:hypothetical protein
MGHMQTVCQTPTAPKIAAVPWQTCAARKVTFNGSHEIVRTPPCVFDIRATFHSVIQHICTLLQHVHKTCCMSFAIPSFAPAALCSANQTCSGPERTCQTLSTVKGLPTPTDQALSCCYTTTGVRLVSATSCSDSGSCTALKQYRHALTTAYSTA